MDITVYSTTTCSFCHMLYKFLDDHDISYREVVTDQDTAGMQEFLKASDGSYPVPLTGITDKDGKQTKILGLDLPKLK